MSTAAATEKTRAEDFLAHRPRCSPTRSATSATRSARSSRDQVLPYVGDWFEEGDDPARARRASSATLGVLGMHLEGYGCAGAERDRLRPRLHGARGGRQRRSAASSRCRARWRCSRSGAGARRSRSSEWLPQMARRRGDRLLRPDRARRRLRPRLDAHPRAPRRRRLDPQRHQDVDHERLGRRRRGRVGADRRRRPRLPRPEGHPRLHHPGHPQEAVAARVDHLRAAARRRAPAGRRAAARGRRRCAARSPA